MKIIGVAGVAGAGKDTFFELLQKKLNCRKASIADALKKEMAPWCGEHYGIDLLNCTRSEKELLRPFLVFHGNLKRRLSDGRHWINILDNQIKIGQSQGVLNEDTTLVITDVRYDEYDNDEVDWLKKELGGTLIHLSQYWYECPNTSTLRSWRLPANDAEKDNDPKLKLKADYIIEWEYLKKSQIHMLNKHIDEFLNWYAAKQAKNGKEDRRLCPDK